MAFSSYSKPLFCHLPKRGRYSSAAGAWRQVREGDKDGAGMKGGLLLVGGVKWARGVGFMGRGSGLPGVRVMPTLFVMLRYLRQVTLVWEVKSVIPTHLVLQVLSVTQPCHTATRVSLQIILCGLTICAH